MSSNHPKTSTPPYKKLDDPATDKPLNIQTKSTTRTKNLHNQSYPRIFLKPLRTKKSARIRNPLIEIKHKSRVIRLKVFKSLNTVCFRSSAKRRKVH